VVKVNPIGTQLVYATFLGGSSSDESEAIAVDGAGNAYVTGWTYSADFPTTVGAFDTSHNGGSVDAFVVKVNPTGTGLAYATFLGGSGGQDGRSIVVDGVGNAYVTGSTGSADFPTTAGAFDTSLNGPGDAFVAKLNPTGTGLFYATFLGGNAKDGGMSIAVDGLDNAYVTGWTQSSNFPTTVVAFDTSYNGGDDAFVAKLNPTGTGLAYATFLGGSSGDYGYAIAVDEISNAYVAGTTNSSNFPTTAGAFDTSYNGGGDTFVAKMRTGETYSISGRVTDKNIDPISGVTMSAGSGINATTDASGVYIITGLITGTYTITPSKSGYTFSPASRTVSVPPNVIEQNFTVPFLDLPLVYDGTASTFAKILKNHNAKGRVTSWFDHKYPNYSKNDGSGIWLYNTRTITNPPDNRNKRDTLICFQNYCYDGHNGIDFSNNGNGTNEDILAAASGVVIEVCENPSCGRGVGYGKYVVIKHRQTGYATFYAHLDQTSVTTNTQVSKFQPIGKMGGTGGYPVHLHFGVYYNSNHNNQWEKGEEVDPYGWKLPEPDPWMEDLKGPQSSLLWIHNPDVQQNVLVNQQTVMTDATGSIQAIIPANTFSSSTTLQLSHGPVAEASAQLRSTGHSFWLRILALLLGNSSEPGNINLSQTTLNQPITLKVTYTNADALHLNTAQLALHYWDDNQKIWQKLLSSVDQVNRTVTAQTQNLGEFDLQAPLICPADTLELNDDIYSASIITLDGVPVNLLFDIPEDQDWFWLPATAGAKYTIQTDNLAVGVDTILELYDTDGVTLLTSDDNSGGGVASKLEWQAPQNGTYFFRVIPASGSAYGCSAGYELSVIREGDNTIYLPVILK
jgi:murein DD-endopeptidase MepM/ murein hydrolase activator NlpD